jgi:hypothetical protein
MAGMTRRSLRLIIGTAVGTSIGTAIAFVGGMLMIEMTLWVIVFGAVMGFIHVWVRSGDKRFKSHIAWPTQTQNILISIVIAAVAVIALLILLASVSRGATKSEICSSAH